MSMHTLSLFGEISQPFITLSVMKSIICSQTSPFCNVKRELYNNSAYVNNFCKLIKACRTSFEMMFQSYNQRDLSYYNKNEQTVYPCSHVVFGFFLYLSTKEVGHLVIVKVIASSGNPLNRDNISCLPCSTKTLNSNSATDSLFLRMFDHCFVFFRGRLHVNNFHCISNMKIIRILITLQFSAVLSKFYVHKFESSLVNFSCMDVLGILVLISHTPVHLNFLVNPSRIVKLPMKVFSI